MAFNCAEPGCGNTIVNNTHCYHHDKVKIRSFAIQKIRHQGRSRFVSPSQLSSPPLPPKKERKEIEFDWETHFNDKAIQETLKRKIPDNTYSFPNSPNVSSETFEKLKDLWEADRAIQGTRAKPDEDLAKMYNYMNEMETQELIDKLGNEIPIYPYTPLGCLAQDYIIKRGAREELPAEVQFLLSLSLERRVERTKRYEKSTNRKNITANGILRMRNLDPQVITTMYDSEPEVSLLRSKLASHPSAPTKIFAAHLRASIHLCSVNGVGAIDSRDLNKISPSELLDNNINSFMRAIPSQENLEERLEELNLIESNSDGEMELTELGRTVGVDNLLMRYWFGSKKDNASLEQAQVYLKGQIEYMTEAAATSNDFSMYQLKHFLDKGSNAFHLTDEQWEGVVRAGDPRTVTALKTTLAELSGEASLEIIYEDVSKYLRGDKAFEKAPGGVEDNHESLKGLFKKIITSERANSGMISDAEDICSDILRVLESEIKRRGDELHPLPKEEATHPVQTISYVNLTRSISAYDSCLKEIRDHPNASGVTSTLGLLDL